VAGERIGYVWVSTLDQNEKRQLCGLVLDRVFTDKASGRDTAWPQKLLGFAATGIRSWCTLWTGRPANWMTCALVRRRARKGVRYRLGEAARRL
jgi:hypothetical protein